MEEIVLKTVTMHVGLDKWDCIVIPEYSELGMLWMELLKVTVDITFQYKLTSTVIMVIDGLIWNKRYWAVHKLAKIL